MTRFLGLAAGAVWIVFTLMAFRAARAGAAAGQADAHLWYTVIGVFLGIAAMVAIVGTLRHRPTGPRK
jgi:uncharacterized membrane protein